MLATKDSTWFIHFYLCVCVWGGGVLLETKDSTLSLFHFFLLSAYPFFLDSFISFSPAQIFGRASAHLLQRF